MLKIENFISRSHLTILSGVQKKEILNAIKNQIPILFTGGASTGKTTLAQELKNKGVVAYAPEMLCVVELGVKNRNKKEDDHK
jgi:Flp pilus assembly CpaF family ATPase